MFDILIARRSVAVPDVCIFDTTSVSASALSLQPDIFYTENKKSVLEG